MKIVLKNNLRKRFLLQDFPEVVIKGKIVFLDTLYTIIHDSVNNRVQTASQRGTGGQSGGVHDEYSTA